MPSFEQYRDEYSHRWETMAIRPDWQDRARKQAQRILDARRHYEPVSGATGVPWHIIGVIHLMECGGSFRGHLHNGDPLTARTRQVPAGRPVKGSPPFTWHDSAVDALRYDGLDKVRDWGPERVAWCLEKFNGFGYRGKGVPSAYLWSGSDQYARGKYVSDGVWSSSAVSQQVGGMVILKALLELEPSLMGADTLAADAAEFPKAEKASEEPAPGLLHPKMHQELRQESLWYRTKHRVLKLLGLGGAGAAASQADGDPLAMLSTAANIAKTYGLALVAVAVVGVIIFEAMQYADRNKHMEPGP
jgi:lysozyme family protein